MGDARAVVVVAMLAILDDFRLVLWKYRFARVWEREKQAASHICDGLGRQSKQRR